LKELSAFDSDDDEGDGENAHASKSGAPASPRPRRKSSGDREHAPSSSSKIADVKPIVTKPETKKGVLIEEEKRAQGTAVWSLVKQYSKIIGLRNVMLIAAFIICLQLIQRACDLWLTSWTGSEDSSSRFSFYVAVYGGLAALTGLVSFLDAAFSSSSELKAASLLHYGMLGRVIRSPMSFFDTTPTGRIVNRFSKDQETLDSSLPENLNTMLSFASMVGSTFITIGLILPIFFVILVPVSYLYFKAAKDFRPFSREIKRLISTVRSPVFSCFGEALHGAPTIRAFGARSAFVSKIENLSDVMNRVNMLSSLSNRWIGCRLDFCGNLVVAFAGLSAVVTRIYKGPSDNTAQTGMALTLVVAITAFLRWSIMVYAELEGSLNAVERVVEYTELHKEAAANMPDDPEQGWLTHGRIEFKEVVMCYREGLPPVLNGVTFVIEGGQKIGVVGRTGAGKSSLIVALYRFAELSSGHITIDLRDTKLLGLKALRSALTIVPQEPVLFSGSVKVGHPGQLIMKKTHVLFSVQFGPFQ